LRLFCEFLLDYRLSQITPLFGASGHTLSAILFIGLYCKKDSHEKAIIPFHIRSHTDWHREHFHECRPYSRRKIFGYEQAGHCVYEEYGDEIKKIAPWVQFAMKRNHEAILYFVN
jgi:hypothetical protein